MSEATSRGLLFQVNSLFILCQKPSPGPSPWDYQPSVLPIYMMSEPNSRGSCPCVKPVYMVSEPTSRGLLTRDVALYTVRTHLQRIVSLGCSQSTGCLIPPPEDCSHGLQPVYIMSEPTSRDCQPRIQPVYLVFKPTSW